MPFNGSGTFVLPGPAYPAVAGTLIRAADWNSVVSDIANGLTGCITKDGQSVPTADITFGGFKLTNVANAVSLTDAVNLQTLQNGGTNYLTITGGPTTITATLASLTAYATGQKFWFLPGGSNAAGGTTLNINGLGAKPIVKNGNVALAAGDFVASRVAEVVYDGTSFQLVNFQFPGMVIDRTYVESTAGTVVTTTIPYDDTIPQVGEGTQIFSSVLSAKSSTNRIRGTCVIWGSPNTLNDVIIMAAFVNGAANSIAASISPSVPAGNQPTNFTLRFEYTPGSTAAQTVTINAGTSAGQFTLNGTGGNRRFGGVSKSTFTLEEIMQ